MTQPTQLRTVPLEKVERELARLWEEESRSAGGSRATLLTLVALVSEPGHLDRANQVLTDLARRHPSRTIAAVWRDGAQPSIAAQIEMHRGGGGSGGGAGAVCGDAIHLEAIGPAREWLPGIAERLALPDLPVCVWWVGDLPDFDDLFDRMVVGADLVVVNSGEMDLRDLQKLSSIAARSSGRYALADLSWIRMRTMQDLVARFFDDAEGQACLPDLERVLIEFAPRPDEKDATSCQAGLLFGWMAAALELRVDAPQWKRGDGWAEVRLGKLLARFEHKPRADVRAGVVTRVVMEAGKAHFAIERQDDPRVYRWWREVPGVATPPHTLRVSPFEEASLLARCIERPKRDLLLETSLRVSSRVVMPVAPRLSALPPAV
jgi:glucose-6-phosphate dehydrogenase assembly protein OpcA